MGLTALDTSALIGYLTAEDALHARATDKVLAALGAGDRLGVPLVAWAELIGGVRSGHGDEAVLRTFRSDLQVELLGLDEITAERAADLRVAGLRLPDALILASAERAGARQVLTGDRRWAGVASPLDVLVL